MGDEGEGPEGADATVLYVVSDGNGREVYCGSSLKERDKAVKDKTFYTTTEYSVIEGFNRVNFKQEGVFGDSKEVVQGQFSALEIKGLLKLVLGSSGFKIKF